MTISKNNKMMQHLNYKMKVIVQDNRTFIGYFKAFDKHMNVILADCEELRRIKPKAGKKTTTEEEKRILGLVLLRGDKIISISVEGPPQRDADSGANIPRAGGMGGPGQAKGAGRGMPMGAMPAQGMPTGMPGLQGPVRGMGGPGMGGVMQPGYPGMPPPGAPGGMPPRFG